jgi:hypothetical protein
MPKFYYAVQQTARNAAGEHVGDFIFDVRLIEPAADPARFAANVFEAAETNRPTIEALLKEETDEPFTWGEIEIVKIETE